MSANLVLAAVHVLAEHGPTPIGRLAGLLGCRTSELRGQLTAFNDVETESLVLDPLFTITPAAGWPDDDQPDPQPSDADVVAVAASASGATLGLAHRDAGVLGPLLAAADQLRCLEPGNLALASAVDTLRTALLAGVTGHAAYRTRTAAMFQRAVERRRQVRITYSTTWGATVGTRVIHPYQVVSTRRGYEVDAGPLDAEGRPRTFLVSGIREHHVLAATFEVPAGAMAAMEANRVLTPVTGVGAHRCMWAVRNWAERVDQAMFDTDDVAFTAWLLPPVAERAALICLAGGPGIDLDDPGLVRATGERAATLLHHHDLVGRDDSVQW